MVDLGCSMGNGYWRNVSDLYLFLDYFHAPGTLVMGVEPSPYYVTELQTRAALPPYSGYPSVTFKVVHAAVGTSGQENAGASLEYEDPNLWQLCFDRKYDWTRQTNNVNLCTEVQKLISANPK